MNFLANKKVLLTAGPTYEPIDPVRFIGNRSSGKMGYAIAEVFAEAGAEVILVSGPVNLQAQHENIQVVSVETAAEMYEACHEHFDSCHLAILAAAVADYTIANPSDIKIKKKTDQLSIDLVKTKDILKSLGQIKSDKQILVGFALETNNELENAKGKLEKKNLDFIVLNSLQDKGAGFKHQTNKITILDKYNKITKFELKDKSLVAQDILAYLQEFVQKMKNN
jgi:phosphopantothenoylcysteine decarboxylase/phosphopantothenate--cysteine ligase